MAKSEENIEISGSVTKALPSTKFWVQSGNNHENLASLSGKMRK